MQKNNQAVPETDIKPKSPNLREDCSSWTDCLDCIDDGQPYEQNGEDQSPNESSMGADEYMPQPQDFP